MNLYAIIKHKPDGSQEWYRGNSGNYYHIRVWEREKTAANYIKHHAKPTERDSLEIVKLGIEEIINARK